MSRGDPRRLRWRHSGVTLAWGVLCLLLWARCTQTHNVAKYTDDQHHLAFAQVHCLPDVFGGEPVEAGKLIECAFVVEGVADTDVELSCETDSGEPVDCLTNTDYLHLHVDTDFPEDPDAPISQMARCRFRLDTQYATGDSIEPVVWVATNGEHTVRHRFAPVLVPDDQLDEVPDLWVECGPNDLDDVHPGQRLNCLLLVHDPDPGDSPEFVVTLVSNPLGPPGPLQIFPISGHGPGILPWTWQTTPHLAPGLWTLSFTIPGTLAEHTLEVRLTPSP